MDQTIFSCQQSIFERFPTSVKILESRFKSDKNWVWRIPLPIQAAGPISLSRRNSARPNGVLSWLLPAKGILPWQSNHWKSFAVFIGFPFTLTFAVRGKVRMMPRI